MIVQAAPTRRPDRPRLRRRAAIGAFGFAALGLVACAPNNTPSSYDDVAESSFMQSCSGDAPEYNGTSTTLAGSDYCTCAYEVFVQNVPFNQEDKDNRRDDAGNLVFASYSGKTYLEYNTELRNDANILAADLVSKLEDCRSNPETVGTTSGSTPGTTPGTTEAQPA